DFHRTSIALSLSVDSGEKARPLLLPLPPSLPLNTHVMTTFDCNPAAAFNATTGKRVPLGSLTSDSQDLHHSLLYRLHFLPQQTHLQHPLRVPTMHINHAFHILDLFQSVPQLDRLGQ